MTHLAPKTTTTQPAERESMLAAMCYEYAVLRTRAEVGIRLPPEDQLALRDLTALLEASSAGRGELKAFPVSIRAWMESPVVKLAVTVVGVSGGGLLVTAWSGIRPGTLVEVRMDGDDGTFTIRGTIRWSKPRGGQISLGVEFTPVPIDQEPLLDARNFRQSA